MCVELFASRVYKIIFQMADIGASKFMHCTWTWTIEGSLILKVVLFDCSFRSSSNSSGPGSYVKEYIGIKTKYFECLNNFFIRSNSSACLHITDNISH